MYATRKSDFRSLLQRQKAPTINQFLVFGVLMTLYDEILVLKLLQKQSTWSIQRLKSGFSSKIAVFLRFAKSISCSVVPLCLSHYCFPCTELQDYKQHLLILTYIASKALKTVGSQKKHSFCMFFCDPRVTWVAVQKTLLPQLGICI